MSAVLNEQDYKCLIRFHFAMSDMESNDFGEKIVHVINEIFENDTVCFVEPQETQPIQLLHRSREDALIGEYLMKYSGMDHAQAYLRDNAFELDYKNIIALSDMSNSYRMRNERYFEFLSRHEITDEMTLVICTFGARIKIFRSASQGNFTDREKSIASYVCNILTSKYHLLRENKEMKRHLDVLDKSIKSMNFGYMLLTRDFKLVENNELVLTYAYEITKTYFVDQMLMELRQMFDKSNSLTNRISRNEAVELSIGAYLIEVIPTVVVNEKNGVDTYYSIHIFSKAWLKKSTQMTNHNFEKYNLTSRESETVELLSKGLSNKEIAARLGISIYTVKEHMKNISRKMEVNSRTAIVSKLAI